MMMQFVQSVLKDNNFKDLIDEEKAKSISFAEFIKTKKLSQSISDYLINAVAMCPNESDSAWKVYKTYTYKIKYQLISFLIEIFIFTGFERSQTISHICWTLWRQSIFI